MEKVCFIHIPKAGGTTLNHILMRNYPLGRIKTFSPSISPHFDQSDPKALRRKLLGYYCIIGHLGFGFTQYLDKNVHLFTMLRKPVDRVVSLYYFIFQDVNHYLHQQFTQDQPTLEEFVRERFTQETSNGQTRQLASLHMKDLNFADKVELGEADLAQAINNLNRCSLVGLVDKFDLFLLLGRKLFGWRDIFYLKRNVTRKRAGVKDLSAETLRLIEKENELDLQLYSHAQALFAAQLESFAGQIYEELEQFRKMNASLSFYQRLNYNYRSLLTFLYKKIQYFS
jgi:hypothetical protein